MSETYDCNNMSVEEYIEILLSKIRNHVNLSESEIRWIVFECEVYSKDLEESEYQYDYVITISKLNDSYVMTKWLKSADIEYYDHAFKQQPIFIDSIKTKEIVQYEYSFYVGNKKKFSFIDNNKDLDWNKILENAEHIKLDEDDCPEFDNTLENSISFENIIKNS